MSTSHQKQELLPFTVNNQLQTFFDDYLIHYVQNVTRRLHRPVKGKGPIIQADQPWEHITYFTCSNHNVIYDPMDKKFKCFYEDWDWTAWRDRKFQDGAMMVAISDDGVHWEKPRLGITKIDGKDTNIVLGRDAYGSVHSATVFLDQMEPDPKKRFKTIYRRHLPGETSKKHKFGKEKITFEMATSPDGIHWKPIEQSPLVIGTLEGDVEIIIRDPITGKLILMGRPHNASTWSGSHPEDKSFTAPYDPNEPFGFLNKRNVWRAESDDGIHWSGEVGALRQDRFDNLDDGFYGLNHWRIGQLYAGIFQIFHGVDDTMDIELVYSRDDGYTWQRPFRNIPYIPRGGADAWDRYMITCVAPPVNVGKETFVYHSGASCHHDWWIYEDMGPDVPEKCNLDMVSYCLGLARLRRDGYVSLDAGMCDGVLATKPFKRGSDKLVINAACEKGGYVAVEVQDMYGRPWPGFTRKDCNVFTGDDTDHVVTWQGKNNLAETSKYIKLAFYMKNASLYTLHLA
jgi:hypothetical protein